MDAQLRLADGCICDQYSITFDCVHLSSNNGVFLYEDLLAILAVRFVMPAHLTMPSQGWARHEVLWHVQALPKTRVSGFEQIHGQTIHLLQILPSGRFMKVHQFGKLCWDDDELVLLEQTHAEELWRSARVRQSPFPFEKHISSHRVCTIVIVNSCLICRVSLGQKGRPHSPCNNILGVGLQHCSVRQGYS